MKFERCFPDCQKVSQTGQKLVPLRNILALPRSNGLALDYPFRCRSAGIPSLIHEYFLPSPSMNLRKS